MGLFSGLELTKEDIEKINSVLPKNFQRNVWTDDDFYSDRIRKQVKNYVENVRAQIEELKKGVDQEFDSSQYIVILNTESKNCIELGMVDIGIVERFGATSTGNRFENDAIGYVIEGAIDNVWSENNAQYNAVLNVKNALKKKAKTLYPTCNTLFKFEIDFRELGSSGNVFIYARGTACISEQEKISLEEEKYNERKEELMKKIEEKKDFFKSNYTHYNFIPTSLRELKNFLGK